MVGKSKSRIIVCPVFRIGNFYRNNKLSPPIWRSEYWNSVTMNTICLWLPNFVTPCNNKTVCLVFNPTQSRLKLNKNGVIACFEELDDGCIVANMSVQGFKNEITQHNTNTEQQNTKYKAVADFELRFGGGGD